MNHHDVSLEGSEWLTSSARRSRTGVLKARNAGTAAATPVANRIASARVR